jgi:uncharacterized iron-regulated membrane protein
MKKTIRGSLTWLHTWCGLLLGWLLYAIFVTGTASYYKHEITQWAHPELRFTAASRIDALEQGYREVLRAEPDAASIYIVLPDDRSPGLFLGWETPEGAYLTRTVDACTAKVQARDSRAGEFFYRFHFELQLPYPWGRWIACFAAVFMLVALITGIVAHRRFFKDFFTFRPGKPGGRSWLDFHNLAGVIALPFYLMISYTALILFLDMFMPWARLAVEPPAVQTAQMEAGGRTGDSAVSTAPAKPERAEWRPMAEQAEKAWGPGRLRSVYAAGLAAPGGTVSFSPANDDGISVGARAGMTFDAATGVLIPGEAPARGIVTRLHDVLYGLHMIHFAGAFLRSIFFFLGLLGTALVATGLVLWTVKRRPRQEALHGPGRLGFGHALVERLNIAVIAGFPASLATFFWANRLLPLGLENRGDREVTIVFIAWGIAAIHPWVRSIPRAWKEQLWTGGALLCLLPLVDAVTGPYLGRALLEGNRTYLGFLVVVFGLGLMLGYAAHRMGRARRGGKPVTVETA